MELVINKEFIENMMDGYWAVQPTENWQCRHISENFKSCINGKTLFIAMDKETWLRGTGNTGIYSEWTDTHDMLLKNHSNINGIICQREVVGIPKSIPQYVVKDPFELINLMFKKVRESLNSNIISITGTVGKTTTKELLVECLKRFDTVYCTPANHNSRTGVKLAIANSMARPKYIVLETAVAALWMRNGGINIDVKPNIGIITQVGVGQKGYSADKMAELKARVANGLDPEGVLIINRDIENYDQVLKFANKYTNNIVAYGFDQNSDIRIEYNNKKVAFHIDNEKFEFTTEIVDLGCISNMGAVISLLNHLKLNYRDCVDLFKSIKKTPSVLEEIVSKKGDITIVDDTYNAEYLSMKNAFEYCNFNYKENRKLVIVGDIINLGNSSKEVHESLYNLVKKNNFSKVATFGKDSKFLNDILPLEINMGHFSNVNDCVLAVNNVISDGDVILVKGSRRNSTINQVPLRLLEAIDHSEAINVTKEMICVYRDEQLIYEKNVNKTFNYGLGSLILLNLALKKYVLNEIKVGDIYKVSSNVDRESNRNKTLMLCLGEEYTFFELIQLVYLTQNSSSILALAELVFGTTNNALLEVKKFAKNKGIEPNKILNITGRDFRDVKQSFELEELKVVLNDFFNMPLKSKKILQNEITVFKNQIKERPFASCDSEYADLIFFIGSKERRIYFSCKYKNNCKEIGVFTNLLTKNRLNYILPYLSNIGSEKTDTIKVDAKTQFINILGDTYFGESYSEIRQKKGIVDSLQKFGYEYSFDKIKKFFNAQDFNIANFEAVFNKTEESPLDEVKGFILGANSQNTIKAFKKLNINNLVLANNHAKDYGSESLKYTLAELSSNAISYIGAGLDQKEALKFYEIIYENKKYAIFNGYWHRNTANEIYNFYALGDEAGVSSLEGMMLDKIEIYKKNNPESKIVVISHWGVDFKPIHSYQRFTAQLLVKAGADLIIGHGPHTIQPLEYIDGKPIIYSIGNGVFNSNGEYAKHNALPFGFIVCIDMKSDVLNLYPIFTNNLESFWQPYPINEVMLEKHSSILKEFIKVGLINNKKNLGYYLEVNF